MLVIAHSCFEISIVTIKIDELPMELHPSIVPESTTVIGDIDQLIAYIESGEAEDAWKGHVRHSCNLFHMQEWHHQMTIQAEIEVLVARDLFGLTKNEMRYILDPADVYGEECPTETFRVLKNNETRDFGEYRSQRLVLGLHTTKLQKLSLTYYMHNLRERLRGNAAQLKSCFN